MLKLKNKSTLFLSIICIISILFCFIIYHINTPVIKTYNSNNESLRSNIQNLHKQNDSLTHENMTLKSKADDIDKQLQLLRD